MLSKPILSILLAIAIMAGAGYWMMHRDHHKTPQTPVYQTGDLEISKVISRPTAPGAPGAGYFTITNTGALADRLLSVKSELASAQLHEMRSENDVMKMRALTDGKLLAAGESTVFEPGGDHVMLMGLNKALVVGDRIRATLTFEKAGTLDVFFEVIDGNEASKHNH